MGELVPRDYYDIASATKDTRKRLARIEQEAIVRRAAIDAAARDAAHELEATEQLRRGRALLRTEGVYGLTEYAKFRSAQLSQQSRRLSGRDSYDEAIQRRFDANAADTAIEIIYRYGTKE